MIDVEMNVHVPGTPDVPDIVRPGDWVTDDGIGIVMIVKTVKCREGEWDYCPGAESWLIYYLGTGYMTGEKVSIGDCGFYSQVVAVDGKLLQLYKLGWNEREITIASKPDYVTVSKSALALIARENAAEQYVQRIGGTLRQNEFIQLPLFPVSTVGSPANR